jgi:predicted nucleotidyltransferase
LETIKKGSAMNREIYKKLKEVTPVLKEKYGIEEFAIFGSMAKGTDTAESDVDIAILKMQLKSGFDLIRAKKYLEEILNRNIDLGTFASMRTFIKNQIQKDFIHV